MMESYTVQGGLFIQCVQCLLHTRVLFVFDRVVIEDKLTDLVFTPMYDRVVIESLHVGVFIFSVYILGSGSDTQES